MHTRGAQTRAKGFTIIELLVVIVLIGLLTAISATAYLGSQRHARDSARKTAVNSIAAAVETYFAAHQIFPGKALQISGAMPVQDPKAVGCEDVTIGASGGNQYAMYTYAYKPVTTACNARTATATFTPSDFAPAPSWIPGLGSYLNPFPIERNYLDSAGGTTDTGFEDYLCSLAACGNTQASNRTRTLVYHNLGNGYAIYARLESSGDVDTLASGTIANTAGLPVLPAGYDSIDASESVYMVRK